MQPVVGQQVVEHRVSADDVVDGRTRGGDDGEQSQWFVDVVRAVVQRLPGKSGGQVAAVSRKDAELSDHVVDRLGAAAEVPVVYGRCVVLHVDPVSDNHRGRHDLLENSKAVIAGVVVTVQEGAACQVGGTGQFARPDDERRVAGQTPFRSCLGPVRRPSKHVGFRGRLQ